jgi:SAM-dependent methyltransferase
MDSAGWDERYRGEDLVWGAPPNRFVEAEFAGRAPGRALDLAAGEGRNALWLAELGWQVTAVDFSPVAAERGRQLAQERGVNVDWVVADLRAYLPGEAVADAVLVVYLHLPPAERAPILARAVRALAPGGLMFVVGHDVTNLSDGIGGPQDPTVLYSPESIAMELDDLRILRAERVRRPVAHEGATVDAIDTLVTGVHE